MTHRVPVGVWLAAALVGVASSGCSTLLPAAKKEGAHDITQAKEAQAELAASHAALQRLIFAQDRVQEGERTRIARELHDDLQQVVAAIRIDLGELAERLLAAGSAELPLVREVDALATRAIVSTRPIARGGTLVEAVLPLSGPRAPAQGDDAADTPFHDSAPAALEAAAAPRLLSHTARRMLQSVIDAIACSIAVVERDGIIRFVNRAWIDLAEHNGGPGAREMGPGVNYLEVCRRSAREDAHADAALRGLREVIDGRAMAFSCEYTCHSDTALRWFRMEVASMAGADLLVMHVLVRSEPRRDDRHGIESAQRNSPPS